MKKIVLSLLMVAGAGLWAAVPNAQAQDRFMDGGMPASGLNIFEQVVKPKAGSVSTGTTSMGTTDSMGIPSNMQAILNSGATELYEYYCPDNKTIKLMEPGDDPNAIDPKCPRKWKDLGIYFPLRGQATTQIGRDFGVYQNGGRGGGMGSNIAISPSVGGRVGFDHYSGIDGFCDNFRTSNAGNSPTCSVGSNSFKGYVDGTIDFLSRNWYPGFGAGLVVDGEFTRSTQVKTSTEGINETEETTFMEKNMGTVWGFQQLGVGVNVYFPIGPRLVVGPSIKRNFWTERYKNTETFISGSSTSVFNDSYTYTGQATEFGGFARYRLWKGLSVEGAVSYENIANQGLTSDTSLNLWDFGFGLRYKF